MFYFVKICLFSLILLVGTNAFGSGALYQPTITSWDLQVTCDEILYKLQYNNSWSMKEGSKANISNLSIQKKGSNLTKELKSENSLETKFFKSISVIDSISPACSEDHRAYFFVNYSSLQRNGDVSTGNGNNSTINALTALKKKKFLLVVDSHGVMEIEDINL